MKADGKKLAAGLFATIMGTGILLVGFQVIPVDPASVHAPFWVIGVCGLALIGCGCALLFESHRAVTNLAGLIVVASLMTVAFWVAFNAPPEEIQGGIPFLSAESNGRIIVQGEFKVDRIKRDRWTTDDVHTIKLIENGTKLCGGESVTE